MYNFEQHIVEDKLDIKEALSIIDQQGMAANVLFVIDRAGILIGSLSDGDIRRGLLRGADLSVNVKDVMQRKCKFLYEDQVSLDNVDYLRKEKIFFVPIVDGNRRIIEVLNLHRYQPSIPVDAIIIAGGKGQRLMPLTKDVPKPLLKVGAKPIIEYNIDSLIKYGIKNIHISVNYLGDKIIEYLGDGSDKNIHINYIKEKEFLGTIASVRLFDRYNTEVLLVMNSDLLTNIDYSEFYQAFIREDADIAIASTTYHVDIPYAVMEVNSKSRVSSVKEKPRYTYYSNAGIYLIKKQFIDLIPPNVHYNVTDLIDRLLELNKKVICFPIMGYWLDIGKHEDFEKAQKDINYISF
ncbi:nucleotidyltransferase family protein [Arcticibacter tournemirensis]|uniref:Nucleotidyltransferase n=1 Tax=Arcticibacter tournemirensis TaxID=699437 RepID=A0A4Q0M7Q4_9SPHI|nr:nucleotidyltransferase family protein [Arcticibacter tournemirensis]RXF69117.1 nucleotidyltransferase [Arcticibacter tournemirensis]